jgi:hypothetical protein
MRGKGETIEVLIPSWEDCTFTLEALPEEIPVRGNASASGDDAYDKQVEDAIIERLDRGDVWAWCCVQMTCSFDDRPITGFHVVGCCSYRDEADFVENSGYFVDLKRDAYEDFVCEHRRLEVE